MAAEVLTVNCGPHMSHPGLHRFQPLVSVGKDVCHAMRVLLMDNAAAVDGVVGDDLNLVSNRKSSEADDDDSGISLHHMTAVTTAGPDVRILSGDVGSGINAIRLLNPVRKHANYERLPPVHEGICGIGEEVLNCSKARVGRPAARYHWLLSSLERNPTGPIQRDQSLSGV